MDGTIEHIPMDGTYIRLDVEIRRLMKVFILCSII